MAERLSAATCLASPRPQTFSTAFRAIRDEQDRLVGYAKVTRDITERKLAQETLDRAREVLAHAQKTEEVDLPHLVQGMTDLLQRSIGPQVHIETRFPLLLKSLPMFSCGRRTW